MQFKSENHRKFYNYYNNSNRIYTPEVLIYILGIMEENRDHIDEIHDLIRDIPKPKRKCERAGWRTGGSNALCHIAYLAVAILEEFGHLDEGNRYFVREALRNLI